MPDAGRSSQLMNIDPAEAIRLIQSGLDKLGHAPGPLPWISKGYVRASDVEPLTGALLTIGLVIWSVADKRRR